MKLELEIGLNLRMMVEEFCRHCEDRYNLGDQVSNAFGLNFGYMVDKLAESYLLSDELKEIIIKVE